MVEKYEGRKQIQENFGKIEFFGISKQFWVKDLIKDTRKDFLEAAQSKLDRPQRLQHRQEELGPWPRGLVSFHGADDNERGVRQEAVVSPQAVYCEDIVGHEQLRLIKEEATLPDSLADINAQVPELLNKI